MTYLGFLGIVAVLMAAIPICIFTSVKLGRFSWLVAEHQFQEYQKRKGNGEIK